MKQKKLMTYLKHQQQSQGFTLIELLVVLIQIIITGIFSILVAVVFPSIEVHLKSYMISQCKKPDFFAATSAFTLAFSALLIKINEDDNTWKISIIWVCLCFNFIIFILWSLC